MIASSLHSSLLCGICGICTAAQIPGDRVCQGLRFVCWFVDAITHSLYPRPGLDEAMLLLLLLLLLCMWLANVDVGRRVTAGQARSRCPFSFHPIARCSIRTVRRLALHLAAWYDDTVQQHNAQYTHISFTQHRHVVLLPAYCKAGLCAVQGAALPHETGGHDVGDVLGFSRLFWASTVLRLLPLA